jgi:hypothetical protein
VRVEPADRAGAAVALGGDARQAMRRFYALVAKAHGEPFDVNEAARLGIEWWRVHRNRQRKAALAASTEVEDALTALYAHVYGVDPDQVRRAAAERATAVRISDRWVEDGCDPHSVARLDERAALVRSYAALLAAALR